MATIDSGTFVSQTTDALRFATMPAGRFRLRRVLLRAILLALAAYVVWDRVEAYRLSRTIAAIAARGEPVRYADAFPVPRTDEQRQASNLYAQAARLAEEQGAEDNHRAGRLDVDRPGGSELSLEDMVAAYRHDASAMQLLDQATPLDFGGFDQPDRELRGYDSPLGQLAAQACLRADLAAARGDGDMATAALVGAVRLQRTLSSSLYRSLHAVRVLGSLRILFRHTQPSDPALSALQHAFDSWPDNDGALKSLLQERARFIDMAEHGMEGTAPAVVRIVLHPLLVRTGRLGIESFAPVLAIAPLPAAARSAAGAEYLRALRPTPRWRWRLFGRLLDPFNAVFTGPALSAAAQELAARRVATTAIAVERFRRGHGGALPASLDGLRPAYLVASFEDPFAGKPLRYRRDVDAYMLYSIDTNRKDDGGELYGHGAAIAKHVGPQSPRDLGIRVPLKPVTGVPPQTAARH